MKSFVFALAVLVSAACASHVGGFYGNAGGLVHAASVPVATYAAAPAVVSTYAAAPVATVARYATAPVAAVAAAPAVVSSYAAAPVATVARYATAPVAAVAAAPAVVSSYAAAPVATVAHSYGGYAGYGGFGSAGLVHAASVPVAQYAAPAVVGHTVGYAAPAATVVGTTYGSTLFPGAGFLKKK